MTQWISDLSGISFSKAGHPKYVCIDDQKTTVKRQKAEMQSVFMYHLKEDSFKIQKVKAPKTNSNTDKDMFI